MFIQSNRKVLFRRQNKTFMINVMNEVVEAPNWIAQDALFRSLVRSGKIKIIVDVKQEPQILVIPEPVIEPLQAPDPIQEPEVQAVVIEAEQVEKKTDVEMPEGPQAPLAPRRRTRRKKIEE